MVGRGGFVARGGVVRGRARFLVVEDPCEELAFRGTVEVFGFAPHVARSAQASGRGLMSGVFSTPAMGFVSHSFFLSRKPVRRSLSFHFGP